MDILKGVITGLILSIPFGPVGIYCMELTVTEGRWKGYITAIGMVTIDVFYSLIALFLLTSLDEYIIKYEFILKILVGLILIIISARKLKSKVDIKEVDVEFKSMFKNYMIGVGFALANISSIPTITFIFGFLQVFESQTSYLPLKLSLGVFSAGASLWLLTTTLIVYFKNLTRKEKLITLVKVVNFIILNLGILIVANSIFNFTGA